MKRRGQSITSLDLECSLDRTAGEWKKGKTYFCAERPLPFMRSTQHISNFFTLFHSYRSVQ